MIKEAFVIVCLSTSGQTISEDARSNKTDCHVGAASKQLKILREQATSGIRANRRCQCREVIQ